jgi:hypothetical protein
MGRLDRIRIKDKCRAEHEFRFIVIPGLLDRHSRPCWGGRPHGIACQIWVLSTIQIRSRP